MPQLRARTSLTAAGLLAAALTLSAVDPYESDNTATLSGLSLLTHGTLQTHDLDGTADVDYMAIDAVPGHSYEVRVATAGQFTANLSRRNGSDGVLQAGDPLAYNTTRDAAGGLSGYSLHSSSVLNWIEPADPASRSRFIRVDSGGATRSAANSQYTVQLRETTVYCPRYNNSATQVTVLMLQTGRPVEGFAQANACNWEARFYDGAYNVFGHALNGSVAGSNSFGNGLALNGMQVLNTAGLSGIAGTSGSIRIPHTCGFGGIQAKAVALEPATGFTFDTTCGLRAN